MKRPLSLFAVLLLFAACSKEGSGDPDKTPVIPVRIIDIEAVNVDNAGRYPFISGQAIKKEAYMIGIKWFTSDADPDGSQYVKPISSYSHKNSPSSEYIKRIYAVEAFNASNPAGSNISQYFQHVDYLPEGVDEGLVLLATPAPGPHSFRVVYTRNTVELSCVTPVVNLQ